MRISKAKAKVMLNVVQEALREARLEAEEISNRVMYLQCARSYLEFIIKGIEKNPSLKVNLEEEN